MTITKAIQRFTWRFKNGWKANENDLEALNTIIDFINNKHNAQLANNEVAFKLYITAFSWFIDHYKTDVFDSIPQKELHKLLNTPLEPFIKRFTDKINSRALEGVLKEKGINPLQVVRNAQNGLKNDVSEVSVDVFDDVYDLESVSQILQTQFNLFLNQYDR
jgi:hypothetical protein